MQVIVYDRRASTRSCFARYALLSCFGFARCSFRPQSREVNSGALVNENAALRHMILLLGQIDTKRMGGIGRIGTLNSGRGLFEREPAIRIRRGTSRNRELQALRDDFARLGLALDHNDVTPSLSLRLSSWLAELHFPNSPVPNVPCDATPYKSKRAAFDSGEIPGHRKIHITRPRSSHLPIHCLCRI